jgi:UDP-N-acetylglucosamine 2-epimerase
MRAARLGITDSGGVQGGDHGSRPVRDNTERPITIAEGTNRLVGSSPAALRVAVASVLATGGRRGRVPELWDGKASERIAKHIAAEKLLHSREISGSRRDRALDERRRRCKKAVLRKVCALRRHRIRNGLRNRHGIPGEMSAARAAGACVRPDGGVHASALFEQRRRRNQ